MLDGMPVPEEAVNAMLSECISLNNPEMARRVEMCARAQKVPIQDSTYCLLIKALSGGKPALARSIIEEVFSRNSTECSAEIQLSVLAFCTQTSDQAMADALFERVKPKQSN